MITRQRLISILTTLTLAALTSACGGLPPGNRSSAFSPDGRLRPHHAALARA
ncbi:MAG: hypothetical protein N2378_01230 [Chloroflexaceae bacterium]|nr:hypothetical protein [Chloroflexaceae bacterium]